MVPILNKLPVFLSSAEMKGLEGLSIYRTQESGKTPARNTAIWLGMRIFRALFPVV